MPRIINLFAGLGGIRLGRNAFGRSTDTRSQRIGTNACSNGCVKTWCYRQWWTKKVNNSGMLY